VDQTVDRTGHSRLDLGVKIFVDSADPHELKRLAASFTRGITTNPSLFLQAGARNFELHAQALLAAAENRILCLPVTGNGREELRAQARWISNLGSNVYVKVPLVHRDGSRLTDIIAELTADGIRVNVTAMMTGSLIPASTPQALSARLCN
jgi:transaldolase